MRAHLSAVPLAVALLLDACAHGGERGQAVEERLDRLERDSAARAQGGADPAASEQAKRLDAKLAEVQGRVGELDAARQKAAADQSAREDALAQELSRMRAALDAYARRLDGLEKALAQRPVGGGGGGARSAPRAPPAAGVGAGAKSGAAPREAAAPPEAVPKTKPGVLALAREQEGKGEKAVARDLYQEYVNRFPDGPDAAQAHFRLGELNFGERRYKEAILEYGKVAREFPRSGEAPDALLRTADSMVALGLSDDAKAVLSEVAKRYPASPAAARAKQRLAELGGSGAKEGRR
jgi:tol-pal system protein YbgF